MLTHSLSYSSSPSSTVLQPFFFFFSYLWLHIRLQQARKKNNSTLHYTNGDPTGYLRRRNLPKCGFHKNLLRVSNAFRMNGLPLPNAEKCKCLCFGQTCNAICIRSPRLCAMHITYLLRKLSGLWITCSEIAGRRKP